MAVACASAGSAPTSQGGADDAGTGVLEDDSGGEDAVAQGSDALDADTVEVPDTVVAPDTAFVTDGGADSSEDVLTPLDTGSTDLEDIASPSDSTASDTSDDTADLLDVSTADVAPSDAAGGDVGADVYNQCDDENPCTIDTFDGSKCVNTYDYGVCCTANPMCDDGNPCSEDLCVLGFCQHEDACCDSDLDCADDDAACSSDRCVNGACVHELTPASGCCVPTLFAANFDDGTVSGLELDNAYPGVGWHRSDSVEATSPPSSLRYGDPLDSDYDNGIESRGIAWLPVVHLPAGVRTILRFDLLLDIETSGGYDLLFVEVVDQATGQIVRYWDKSRATAFFSWQQISIDLSGLSGHDVRVRFRFDTIDNQENVGRGVFIDNLELTSDCAGAACTFDADCDDVFPYTTDRCVIASGDVTGTCTWLQNSTYCATSSECDDGLPCTSNVCSGGQCAYVQSPSCCLSDAECDDGNPCTSDDCSGLSGPYGGQCLHFTVQTCCLIAAQCNDGDPCTVDSCPVQGGPCLYTQLDTCCSDNADCDDGDACTTDLCGQGACVHEGSCCATDAGCDDGDDVCSVDRCVDGRCQHTLDDSPSCCIAYAWNADFYGGTNGGFSLVMDSNLSDGVGWYAVTDVSQSPFGAYHFGSQIFGNTYATGARVFSVVESGSFLVPVVNAVALSFWVRLDTEWSNAQGSLAWDRLDVRVHPTDGQDGEVVWSSADGSPIWWLEAPDGTPAGPVWTQITGVDLSAYRGRVVRLRLSFDSVDEEANAFGGVWIDDLRVTNSCY